MFDWAKNAYAKTKEFVAGTSSEDIPIEQQNVDPAMLAENDRVLAGLQDLSFKLGASNQLDDAMDRNLQRLRKEGSGL